MHAHAELHILYEDNHLLAVNKEAGVLVQGDETGDEPLVEQAKRYLKEHYQKPGAVFLGVVHRLDRPVSGVVIFARTSKALERMNTLFRDRETKKIYWAIVRNRPPRPEDTLVHWLRKDEAKNKTTAFSRETENTLRSELRYRIAAESGGFMLLEVQPITGRPHQIRVQLAAMGCPIAGDVKYGYPEPWPDASIGLHARSLAFVHPIQKVALCIEAAPPQTRFWAPFTTDVH